MTQTTSGGDPADVTRHESTLAPEETEWIGRIILDDPDSDPYILGDIALRLNGTVFLGNRAFLPKDPIDFVFCGHHATRDAESNELWITAPDGEIYRFEHEWHRNGPCSWLRYYPCRKIPREPEPGFLRTLFLDLCESTMVYFFMLCLWGGCVAIFLFIYWIWSLLSPFFGETRQ